jgi:hypothetical protein
LSGLVRSSEGQPVSGATVDFILATIDDAASEPVWRENDWGPLARTTSTVETGIAGEFAFEDIPTENPHGAVICATHPGFEANVRWLDSDHAWPTPLQIVLEPVRPMKVVVLDGGGRAAVGATVEHFGLAAPAGDGSSAGLTGEQARRQLQRSYRLAEDGTVAISPFPGTQVLLARRGEEASPPWRGKRQDEVTLTLGATFTIGGRVSLPDWEFQTLPSERRITIAAQTRNLWRELHTIRAVEGGPWGPVRLPLVAAERYRVRLEGAPIVPVEVFIPPPSPGARLEHDLVAELGMDLWVRVTDEQDRVIPTAEVRVQWQDPHNVDHWNFARASQGASGQIGVRSIPRGSFKCAAFAPGHESRFLGPLETSPYETAYLPITLRKAGLLSGQCLHNGKPVEDFEVFVWQPAVDDSTNATAFVDRQDGKFELDNVPLGEFWVTASSPETPSCEPVVVSSSPERPAEVTLHLLDGVKGHGRVFDLATGAPLAEAAIQMFVKGDAVPVSRWGLPFPVRSDGSFDLRGFLPGLNGIRALAPGYSSVIVEREASSAAAIDWGDIALARAQDFMIRLEPAERADGATVLAAGSAQLPSRTFSLDGTVVYPGISAGIYVIGVTESDGTHTFIELEWLAGQDWTLKTRIAGPNYLSVGVASEHGNALPTVSKIEVSYQSLQGFRTVRTKRPRGGSVVEFEGIDGPSVLVQVFARDGAVTTASGAFRNGRLHLELSLSDEVFLLRVVDSEGEPLPDVRVILTDPTEPGFALFGGTNAQGECELKGVPKREVAVTLQHGTRGSHFGIPIDASSGSAELVLDGSARLELQLLDGELPLRGVGCDILDHGGTSVASGTLSDDKGRVTFNGLGADTYTLRATRSDCWPTEFEATARAETQVTRVQMRRLATLEIVVSQGGLPVSGLPIELTSIEFDSDVAEWIAAERVRSEGLVTDHHGGIRIERLPRGPYRWRIARGSGEPLEGELELEPARDAPILIVLP